MRKTIRIAALAAAALFVATGCNVMRGDQQAGEYVDDAALTARVKAALLDDEQVAGTRFDVNVYQGKVTLSGVTDKPEEARRAEQIARDVPGVRGVESTIRIAQADPSGSASSSGQTSTTDQGSTSGQGSTSDPTSTTDQSTPPEESSTTPPPQQ